MKALHNHDNAGVEAPRSRQWTAKRVLVLVGIGVGLLVAFIVVVLGLVWHFSLANTAGRVNFDRRLPVPRLADSTLTAEGVRQFELRLQAGKTAFYGAEMTDTWGVNGSYLGPTVRVKRGETVRMVVKNDLPEASTLHWHGMHLPAVMDGGPHQPVAAGATWLPSWTINQPAATLWYHPHPHGQTAAHLYRGLAGMLIVDDDTVGAKQLPQLYGVDDIPVIIQDKKFDSNKQLQVPDGNVGKDIVVNGALTPYLPVSTQLVRLRLLNGSTSRIYNLGLSNGRPLQLIGTDGGLLARPVTMTRLMLSPGERAEVVVALNAGETTVLRSYPAKVHDNFFSNRTGGGDDTLDIMQLRAATKLSPSPGLPPRLAVLSAIEEPAAVVTRAFELAGFKINRQAMDLGRIDLVVQKDQAEVWVVHNIDGQAHNFHIHDTQFRILAVNGGPSSPQLAGLKDTVLVLPGQTIRLLVRFTDFSDAQTPYMFHCHLLTHEDKGMMGQFVVVEPGQMPPRRIDAPVHQH